jgi:flavin-dependent dehydrogenase
MIRSKSESNEAMKNDVFIVGGGPAGLAAGIAIRSRGLSVAVADIATPPFDKACGEGLMPDAVASLANLGVRIAPEDGYLFDGIRFIDGNRKVEAAFPSGTGVGIRRPTLHRILVDRAREAGVMFFWGVRVDHWCGWPYIARATVGWVASATTATGSFRVSPALLGQTLDRPR